MNRLRARTHVERIALTLTTLAAFYAIWLGIGLPGLGPGIDAGHAQVGKVVEAEIGSPPRPAHAQARRRTVRPARVQTRTGALTHHVLATGPAAPTAAPPPPTPAPTSTPVPAQPDREPLVTTTPAPPPAPSAATAAPAQLPSPPTPPPAEVVQTVTAAARSTVDAAAGAVPPTSLLPSLSP